MTMQRSERFRTIETAIPNALKGDELLLFFQPIFDLKKKNVSGYEALLRWDSRQLGWLEPAEFIPVAEETGNIMEVGSWVLARSCAQANRWPNGSVGVNISRSELLDPLLTSIVDRALSRSHLLPQRLALEISETTYFETRDEAAATLAGLRERGVRIVIDETTTVTLDVVGNGPFPVDGLKVARGLMTDIGSIFCKPADQDAIRRIVTWGVNRGITVVGTGIENEKHLAFLQDCGADLAQGFHLGRPLPADRSTLNGLSA
jgi:EAL domain-containing protein (putative c-di-GMP-specific phosphodiesterase class I)